MPVELVIKPFSIKDIDDLVELVHTTVKNCYPICYEPEVVEFFIEYHKPQELNRKAGQGSVLLAFRENSLVATGYLVENEIGGVYVHPNFQKQGIGSQIIENLLKLAIEKRLNSVWLDSTPFAVSLYKKFGFNIIEERVDYVKDGVPLEYYYMKKALLYSVAK